MSGRKQNYAVVLGLLDVMLVLCGAYGAPLFVLRSVDGGLEPLYLGFVVEGRRVTGAVLLWVLRVYLLLNISKL